MTTLKMRIPRSVPPRILVFAGSSRKGALSGRTAEAAAREILAQGGDVTLIALGDYPLPLMDEDLERESGAPDNAMKLARHIAGHEGFLIASPEYNASIPPLLKNALDWVSRVRRDSGRPFKPFEGKVAALCSSSGGNFGGLRGLYHLRAVLMACQVEVLTPQCSIARAHEAFNDDGDLIDERARTAMEAVCAALVERAAMLVTRLEP